MAVRRVQVVWTGATVEGGGLSTFYFNDAVGTAAQNVSSVAAFLAGTEGSRSSGLAWATVADVATLNVGSGALESITATTPSTGVGTASGDVLPMITQGLLRLVTSQIVNGRLLRGRLFLPGPVETVNSSAGAPLSGYLTDYNGDAATLVADANSDWSVWSITHGVLASVQTATVWNKWASLRSRRD